MNEIEIITYFTWFVLVPVTACPLILRLYYRYKDKQEERCLHYKESVSQ